jgi:hypothetical protein
MPLYLTHTANANQACDDQNGKQCPETQAKPGGQFDIPEDVHQKLPEQ